MSYQGFKAKISEADYELFTIEFPSTKKLLGIIHKGCLTTGVGRVGAQFYKMEPYCHLSKILQTGINEDGTKIQKETRYVYEKVNLLGGRKKFQKQ